MTSLAQDVKALLEPVVVKAQMEVGPVLWQRLRQAADHIYGICEDEEQAAERMCEMVQELEQRLDDAGING